MVGTFPKFLRACTCIVTHAGDGDWDVKLAAWLLWLRQHGSAFWQHYCSLLPLEEEMACFISFREGAELQELQLPIWKVRRHKMLCMKWMCCDEYITARAHLIS